MSDLKFIYCEIAGVRVMIGIREKEKIYRCVTCNEKETSIEPLIECARRRVIRPFKSNSDISDRWYPR